MINFRDFLSVLLCVIASSPRIFYVLRLKMVVKFSKIKKYKYQIMIIVNLIFVIHNSRLKSLKK